MSYIQIEIGGKLRGLKFNQMALEIFVLNLSDDGFTSSTVYAMFYAGLKANCYQKQEEADFTFSDVVDWVEEVEKNVLQKVNDIFAETQVYKEWLAKFKAVLEPVEEPKKKASRKKSLTSI